MGYADFCIIHQIHFHHASTNENRKVEAEASYNHRAPTYITGTYVQKRISLHATPNSALASLLGNFTQVKKFRLDVNNCAH